MKSRWGLLVLSGMLIAGRLFAAQTPQAAPSVAPKKLISDMVMLQGFHWESRNYKTWWNIVASAAPDIAKSGFDSVWLPPSSDSADPQGYMPRRLYMQDSFYGTIAQLQAAVGALHANGIMTIGDIVINHRVGTSDWGDFTMPQWSPDAVCSNDEWKLAKGKPDSGEGFHAARDLDHSNPIVQDGIIKWMLWLKKNIGYDGWRYDYTKGYGGGYVGLYNDSTKPFFSVGELWTGLDLNNPNAHRQLLCNWINSTQNKSSAFDFTTKGILQQAVATKEYWRLKDSNGKPIGLIGWWPEKAVTFVDNHDTGPSTGGNGGQHHWPFPAQHIMQGYAYILTHPGIPCVYWPHFYDWKLHDEITRLILFRKSHRISSISKIKILAADNERYAAQINDNVIVKIGPDIWSPGEGWHLALYGKDYAIWDKTAQ